MNPYPVPGLDDSMARTGPEAPRPRPVRRALFVDRDGTLNPDLHYLRKAERLELFRGVGNALSLAHDHGYLVICVTNQSGVERGFYTRADVERIHERLNELLRPHRARVDGFYYCPHTPETRCECRKPGTLLFRQARDEWNIDFATSAIVGDRDLDVEAGRELGLLTAVVATPGHEGDPSYRRLRDSGAVDVTAGSFSNAVLRILARG
ncbi:MAG: HAD family hydrolase [Thermoplasmata archaeon]